MSPHESIHRLYMQMTILELRMLNSGIGDGRLSYGDVLYLTLIRYVPGCTSSRLAEMLNVSKSAVTLRVNGLVDMGLVTRTRSETDRRVQILGLAEGVADVFDFEDRMIRSISDSISERYDAEQVGLFCDMVDSVSGFIPDSLDGR